MNIIHGIAAHHRIGAGARRQQVNPNKGAQERRKLVFSEDRRKRPERRVEHHKIPVELRSGEDRRAQNRLSITT